MSEQKSEMNALAVQDGWEWQWVGAQASPFLDPWRGHNSKGSRANACELMETHVCKHCRPGNLVAIHQCELISQMRFGCEIM